MDNIYEWLLHTSLDTTNGLPELDSDEFDLVFQWVKKYEEDRVGAAAVPK